MAWTRKLGIIILIGAFFNLVDLGFTWIEVTRGYAQELNPVMQWAIGRGFWTFFFLKNALDFGGLWWLWRMRYHYPRVVIWSVSILFSFYVGLFLMHLLVLTTG